MHIHILGICGTFMGGIAAIAREAGHRVTGCDASVYPPMSDQLQELGIELIEGYDPGQLALRPDLWVVGNVVSRGNPLMEAILDAGQPYVSGPQWLAEHVLRGRWVLAAAGTHGKTTTASLLAAILERTGRAPGFLIGGLPRDFGVQPSGLGLADFQVTIPELGTLQAVQPPVRPLLLPRVPVSAHVWESVAPAHYLHPVPGHSPARWPPLFLSPLS